jgi:hypothetical protein
VPPAIAELLDCFILYVVLPSPWYNRRNGTTPLRQEELGWTTTHRSQKSNRFVTRF